MDDARSEPSPRHGESVHTFLLADLVGYSALTEAMGDEQAADVAADFSQSVRALLTEYEAEEIKAIGDALLLRFPTAGPAVHLAARLKSEFGTRHGSLAVRVGVHTGSAVHRDGDWFGSAVNIAARVAEQAQPGEVLMTPATVGAAGDALLPGQVRSRGKRALKNMADPVELFALATDATTADRRLPIDPVCRMAVDPHRGAPRYAYRASEYHFCSETCRDAFVRDPERYIRRRTAHDLVRRALHSLLSRRGSAANL
jgi:adenylate cyclase